MAEAARAHWAFLALAIVCEIVATSTLERVDGFSRPGPSIVVVAMYGAAFYGLARALEGIPLGVAYAIWSGVGLPMVALVGFVVHRQSLDRAALLGIGLVAAGVAVIGLFSRSAVR